MNLTRALEVALPDIPARKLAESTPRLDPGTTFREHIEDGKPDGADLCSERGWNVHAGKEASGSWPSCLTASEATRRSPKVYSQQSGAQYDAETVREFAASLEASEFWYKTPQEKNIQLMQMNL